MILFCQLYFIKTLPNCVSLHGRSCSVLTCVCSSPVSVLLLYRTLRSPEEGRPHSPRLHFSGLLPCPSMLLPASLLVCLLLILQHSSRPLHPLGANPYSTSLPTESGWGPSTGLNWWEPLTPRGHNKWCLFGMVWCAQVLLCSVHPNCIAVAIK